MKNKMLRVTMPDQSKWDIPVDVIAKHRAEYYGDIEGYMNMSIEEAKSLFEDEYEVEDWAVNNMNWTDVCNYAVKVSDSKKIDYEEGWINGHKELVTV